MSAFAYDYRATPFVRLPAVPGRRMGCLHSPRAAEVLGDKVWHPGFGIVALTRNGEVVRFNGGRDDDPAYWKTYTCERLAKERPHGDWRICIDGPLSSQTYQRQGPGNWVLVDQGLGFA